MRHFLWYDETGSLRGVHRHSGGWPAGEDLRDGQSASSKVQSIRSRMAQESEFSGFASFECMCPADHFMCPCAYGLLHDHYFDGTQIVPKPALLVEVDGQVVPTSPVFTGNPLDKTPHATLSVVLKASVPDGHSVQVINGKGHTPLITGPTHLTFSDGVSEALSIQVPDQGLFGIVGGESSLIRRFVVPVRGWA